MPRVKRGVTAPTITPKIESNAVMAGDTGTPIVSVPV